MAAPDRIVSIEALLLALGARRQRLPHRSSRQVIRMPGQRFRQKMRRLAARLADRPNEVIRKLRAVVKVGAIINDCPGPLPRGETPQISHSLLGYQQSHVMLGMVGGRHIGTILEMLPLLASDSVTKIDRYALRAKSPEPPIPFIILPHNMRRIDIAVNIRFDGCVHGNHSQPPDDFRVIRNFLRAQDDFVPVPVDAG